MGYITDYAFRLSFLFFLWQGNCSLSLHPASKTFFAMEAFEARNNAERLCRHDKSKSPKFQKSESKKKILNQKSEN